MRLYYFKPQNGNFGDDLNKWLWPKLLDHEFFDERSDEIFVGIGTLLNHRVPVAAKTFVFGSGFGYGSKPKVDETWHFFCVRGPRTAVALGLPPEAAVTDPAILIYDFTRDAIRPTKGRVGFIPHCDSAEAFDWQMLAHQAGLQFIDPRWSVDRVIAEIGACEKIVTEAMHGAIFADAMRVPWVPVVAYPHISTFKWQDWCESMCLVYSPLPLEALWRGEQGTSLGNHVKQSFKRQLKRFGVWSANWTPAQPARSSNAANARVLSQLRALADATAILSTDDTHALRLSTLHERLNMVRALKPAKAGHLVNQAP